MKNHLGTKILCAFASILLVLSFLALFAMNGVTLFGFTTYNVNQNNMSPSINQNSLVICKKVDNYDYKEGDTVAFMSSLDTGLVAENDFMIERVASVDTTAYTVTTKSDNPQSPRALALSNDLSTETNAMSTLIGKVVYSIPFLGALKLVLNTIPGMTCLFVYFAILILLILLPTRYRKPKEGKPAEIYGENQKLRGTKLRKN
ncbi:MAG: hypothetical protein MJ189_03580 [Coriobacteriales bacterium]|nr:hypothetical protein [Coriobacteriales bacterium]